VLYFLTCVLALANKIRLEKENRPFSTLRVDSQIDGLLMSNPPEGWKELNLDIKGIYPARRGELITFVQLPLRGSIQYPEGVIYSKICS
jgi:hypothetical protein